MIEKTAIASKLIRENGDLLEREMFSDPGFCGSFDLYPIVWSKYILHKRAPGLLRLADENWLRFAECHYTTIVRCWMAYNSICKIDEICEESMCDVSASAHLELHTHLFGFFCSLGAAIENMRETFKAPPVNSEPAFQEICSRRDQNRLTLEMVFELRHQFIHSVIVPCFDDGGLLSLNEALLRGGESRWNNRHSMKIEEASGLCDSYWECFIYHMRNAWSELLDQLKLHEPRTIAEIDLSHPLDPEQNRSCSPMSYPTQYQAPGPSGVKHWNIQ